MVGQVVVVLHRGQGGGLAEEAEVVDGNGVGENELEGCCGGRRGGKGLGI